MHSFIEKCTFGTPKLVHYSEISIVSFIGGSTVLHVYVYSIGIAKNSSSSSSERAWVKQGFNTEGMRKGT